LPGGKEMHMEFGGVVVGYIIDRQVLGEGGDGEARFSVV